MAQAPKRRRYSSAPDLKIEVGGSVFEVHSQMLMLRSPVFKSMLESDMVEADEGLIHLPGKKTAEFEVALPFISSSSEFPAIAPADIPMLLRWADEYDLAVLRERCEQELKKREPSVASLQLAVRYGLDSCKAKFVDAITRDLLPHVDELDALVDDPATMELLIPAIFNTTKVLGEHMKVSRIAPILTRTLWPFVRATLLDALDAPFSVRPSLKPGSRVRILSNVARVRHLCVLAKIEWCDWTAEYAGQVVEIVLCGPSNNFYVTTQDDVAQRALFPWSVFCPLRSTDEGKP